MSAETLRCFVTTAIHAATSGEPSAFGFTLTAACWAILLEIVFGDRDIPFLASFFQQLAVDNPFEHLESVPLDALLRQVAYRDLSAVDDGGHCRHPRVFRGIGPDGIDARVVLQLLEDILGHPPHLGIAYHFLQLGRHFLEAHFSGGDQPFAFPRMMYWPPTGITLETWPSAMLNTASSIPW